METKRITQEEALRKAMNYCGRRERCTSDIYKALNRWGLAGEFHDSVIKRLMQLDFVNDERYAGIFVNSHLHINGWGRAKIRHGLRAKGISKSTIERSLDALSDDEYLVSLKKIAAAKWKHSKGNLYDRRIKTHNYLVRKGFEPALSRQIVFALK